MEIKLIDIGIVGAGVMGSNLARNMAEKGYHVGVFDLDFSKAVAACKESIQVKEGLMEPCKNLESLVERLSKPRKIGLLINAGNPVDDILLKLSEMLDEGDIVMDMGNSFYKDTQEREMKLSQKGIVFFGVGISGGEKGARFGPSIMAGSNEYGWHHVCKIINDICAITEKGEKCCRNFGNHGAGHFVKMVHNGIEYAYMEAISEIYMILKKAYGKEAEEIGKIFREWTQNRKVNSYLLEITSRIIIKKDDNGDGLLIDKIKDSAGSKGTGLWTSQTLLELNMCAPVLIEALMLRYLSAESDTRKEYIEKGGNNLDSQSCIDEIFNTLEFIQYVCFEQGLKIIEKASEKYGWIIDLTDVISVWEAGCIIRTDFMDTIKDATRVKKNSKIFACQEIQKILTDNYKSVNNVLNKSIMAEVPTPVISSGLQYYIASKSEFLPTSMIQAQRDYFGAHGYERVDLDGSYHSEW